ncbi:hypothetical protein OUZ56_021267 [Daphnia magna]|uniref:Uncharacterized protein n=1 Tax=Daphnia magna TaxID=35525 RepID=A0ABQ9ZGW2_9CRUS|nr:hypothetical protein OUZ56_021267 [Daphnia magna]
MPISLSEFLILCTGLTSSMAKNPVVTFKVFVYSWEEPILMVIEPKYSTKFYAKGLLPSKNLVNKPQPVSERPVQPPLPGRAFKIIITNSPMSSLISVLK